MTYFEEATKCDNCGDWIKPDDPVFHDPEEELNYCFYCNRHLFLDPYEDVPYDLEDYG